MYENTALFRKRFIPDELTWLKDDEILFIDDERIVTRWKSLKPRNDFSGGCSTYYRKKGLKISRIFDRDGKFLHWYCDIVIEQGKEALSVNPGTMLKNGAEAYIRSLPETKDNVIVFTDLLVDIIINRNGLIEVADLNEVADMLEKGTITRDEACFALRTAHEYLHKLYSRYSKDTDFSSDDFVNPY